MKMAALAVLLAAGIAAAAEPNMVPAAGKDSVYVLDPQRDAMQCSWNEPVEPFCIMGNIYYVGAAGVSSYLVTTSQGNILIETGFAETAPLIEKNIEKLGFRLSDVKVLLVSHAHYDHAGGLAELKGATGAKFIAMEQEAAALARGGRDDFAFGDRLAFRPVKADQVIQDSDKVELGGVVIISHLTPGHTRGCTAWTMKASEGGKSYDVVLLGGTSIPGYTLTNNAKYPQIIGDYAHTFEVLRGLKCDVFLAMHGFEFGLKDKMQRLAKGQTANPFIDPQGYRKAIDKAEKNYRDQLAKEQGK
jgi:metallo-beta-lactamase class B